ncbi:hypothetical protein [Catellatospora citrea]|uniref:Uncharacterized protein n=1 Tax=Catellatospora citrea TaxID=53366 RepID=A0A8J3NY84_9ACTN|nr:hypothetical protein [Catellatospora citrea]RKE05849.1 hypothetical protein C8E86_0659 [Catellatospora citrea]GIF97210.1 hypothetical protein Cci01nite_23040 [Catellatospora citrea]
MAEVDETTPPPAAPARRIRLRRGPVPGVDRFNAMVTGGTLLVSVVALVFTALTLSDQQSVNEMQLELNTIERQRQLRIYSSRVSMWVQVGDEASTVRPRGLDVQIANRSPVPVRAVTAYAHLLKADGATAERGIVLGDIPPCSQISYRVFARSPWAIERRDHVESFGLSLVFLERTNTWRLTYRDLEPTAADQAKSDPEGAVGAITDDATPLSDCGEGA